MNTLMNTPASKVKEALEARDTKTTSKVKKALEDLVYVSDAMKIMSADIDAKTALLKAKTELLKKEREAREAALIASNKANLALCARLDKKEAARKKTRAIRLVRKQAMQVEIVDKKVEVVGNKSYLDLSDISTYKLERLLIQKVNANCSYLKKSDTYVNEMNDEVSCLIEKIRAIEIQAAQAKIDASEILNSGGYFI